MHIFFFQYILYIGLSLRTIGKMFVSRNRMNIEMKREKNINNFNILSKPRGSNQIKYNDYLDNNNYTLIVAHGPAGTGKTMFACMKAINMLKKGELNKIIITRPVVPVEEEIGFLPGNIVKKMDPWTRPIFDVFLEHYSKSDIDNMIHNNIIEISPLAYMRGRTFKNSFIIADEMQNSSPNQMLMLTTRIGENSRMVITGDLKQSDKLNNNGLYDLIHKLNAYHKYNHFADENSSIKIVEFNSSDIERSKVVSKILEIYNYKYIGNVNNANNANNISSIKNNTTPINGLIYNNFTKIYNYSEKWRTFNNDAALIPKSHSHTFRKIWEQ